MTKRAITIHPHDIIETGGHLHPRLYSVQGIHLGGLNQEDVVEILPIDRTPPDAHGEKVPMYVPLEMILHGVSAGFFNITQP